MTSRPDPLQGRPDRTSAASADSGLEIPEQWPAPAASPSLPRDPQSNPARNPARTTPVNEPYQPPANVPSYHGSGEWSNDGYVSTLPVFAPSTNQTSAHQQSPSRNAQQSVHTSPQANRRIPLGPPPSARRGPASYYPQIAPVHPIVEESDSGNVSARSGARNSPISSNSSNVVHIGVPSYYLNDTITPNSEPANSASHSRHESPSSSRADLSEHTDPVHTQPVRPIQSPTAEPSSVVRRVSGDVVGKPQLVTVKSRDRLRSDASASTSSAALDADTTRSPRTTGQYPEESWQDSRGNPDTVAGAVPTVGAMVAMSRFARSHDDLSMVSASTGAHTPPVRPSTTSSLSQKGATAPRTPAQKPISTRGAEFSTAGSQRSTSANSGHSKDPRMQEILSSLEKGGAYTPSEDTHSLSPGSLASKYALKTPTPGMSDRPGKPRPPPLEIESTRNDENRTSLMGLSDLIRRATRLASNVDRDRNGHHSTADGNASEKRDPDQRDSEYSGILFPPMTASPSRRWSSNRRHSALGSRSSDSDVCSPNRRKWCGLPVWLFLLLVVIGILVIAAAIIIPVALVVIPNQNKANSYRMQAACNDPLPCENGGTNVANANGNCECLCVNGFTGSTCGIAAPIGCTTTTIGSTPNAVIGSALPFLLSGADANFSIPLNGQTLYSIFTSVSATCGLENQLVTFTTASNTSAKRTLLDDELELDPISPAATLIPRQATTATTSTSTTSPSTSSSTSSPASSSTGTLSPSQNTTTVSFAGVTVLYVLQVSGQLDTAVSAQDNLQSFFQNPSASEALSLDLQNGYSCDLTHYVVKLPNGTLVPS